MKECWSVIRYIPEDWVNFNPETLNHVLSHAPLTRKMAKQIFDSDIYGKNIVKVEIRIREI